MTTQLMRGLKRLDRTMRPLGQAHSCGTAVTLYSWGRLLTKGNGNTDISSSSLLTSLLTSRSSLRFGFSLLFAWCSWSACFRPFRPSWLSVFVAGRLSIPYSFDCRAPSTLRLTTRSTSLVFLSTFGPLMLPQILWLVLHVLAIAAAPVKDAPLAKLKIRKLPTRREGEVRSCLLSALLVRLLTPSERTRGVPATLYPGPPTTCTSE